MAKRFLGLASAAGLGIGVGMALGASSARSGSRPVLVGAMKGLIAAGEQAARVAAEAREQAEDLYHEARAERDLERRARQAHSQEQNGEEPARTVYIPQPR